ncbi:zf-HC2 domain-containing protein [Myxococcus stipitatus]|uniref:anti-sigma factor family protein n=1 Tax=Myxococcus stipitatus TaxID=83455 RepID=UPI003145476E
MEACSLEWQERLSAAFDGENPAHEQRALEQHLERCAGCARELARYDSLRVALRAQADLDVGVSAGLKARVDRLASRPRWAFARGTWAAGGAIAALLTVGVFGASRLGVAGGLTDALAMDLERHHLKAFSRAAPCEFESSNPEDVKAWVEREVGYEVDVPSVPGAELLGARRCQLHGEVSASLLYRHGDKAMTLFLPEPGSPVAKAAARFAGDGTRCTQGPVGERICVAPRGSGHAALAVSEAESPVLLEALARLSP